VGNGQIGGAHLAQLRIIDSAVHVDLATVPIVGQILQQLVLDHGHNSPPALGCGKKPGTLFSIEEILHRS